MCHDEAANHQLPIAAAFQIILIVSTEECSSLIQNSMQIYCSTCSAILNVPATQYTYLLNGVYRPHWLVQWSCHCSHKHIPVHFPQLPGYTDVMQTILVILTMAGWNFSGRPHIYTYEIIIIYTYIDVYMCVCVCIWYIHVCVYINMMIGNITYLALACWKEPHILDDE